MKLLIKIIILFAILVCAQNTIAQPTIDPRLKSYVEHWLKNMDDSEISYSSAFNRIDRIYFKSLDPSDKRLGYSTYGKREVWLSTKLLGKDEYLILTTLYHELGHYVFQLDHSTGIMAENKISNESYYKNNWNKLLAEYLLKCKD